MYKAIRYIGSKQKVLNFLEEHLFSKLSENGSFYDGFLGSGVVSQYVVENYPNVEVSGGDISKYSESLFQIMNIGSSFNEKELIQLFELFEKEKLLPGDIFNELSSGGIPKTYHESRNFFHQNVGKTIDTFKLFVNQKEINGELTSQQVNILYFFLLAYSCKMANTTSVFGAYLKSTPKYEPLDKNFIKKIVPHLNEFLKKENNFKFYLGDIVSNLKKIGHKEVIYLDPPYSTRRYESNYHVLNFIVDPLFAYNNIKDDSKTAQPKQIDSNPFGKKKDTELIFREMIIEGVAKSDYLGISYNTDGLIKEDWIERFCKEQKFKLETKKLTYKRFKSKTENKNESNLEEILWIITK